MILEAAFGYSIWQMVKANSIDEKTLKTLEKAHMTYQDALASFDQHKSDADGKLVKLINRKKAMLINIDKLSHMIIQHSLFSRIHLRF